jgi:hypothetical protein
MVVTVRRRFCRVSVVVTADVEGGTRMVKDESGWISAGCDEGRMNWNGLRCNGGTILGCIVDVDCKGCCVNV